MSEINDEKKDEIGFETIFNRMIFDLKTDDQDYASLPKASLYYLSNLLFKIKERFAFGKQGYSDCFVEIEIRFSQKP